MTHMQFGGNSNIFITLLLPIKPCCTQKGQNCFFAILVFLSAIGLKCKPSGKLPNLSSYLFSHINNQYNASELDQNVIFVEVSFVDTED